MNTDELGPHLWTACDGRYRAVFAEGDATVTCFNTLGTRAADLAGLVAGICGGKPLTHLVYTLDHLDHTIGGTALGVREVVAHAACARLVACRSDPRQLPVTRALTGDCEQLDLDGVSVELIYPGPVQGTGNLAAWFPAQRVLFLVGPQADARYGLLPDYHVEHYASSVRSLLSLPFETFVPGRYETMTRPQLERAVDYFEALQVVAQKAFAGGVPVWDLRALTKYVKERLRGSFGDLAGFDEHVGTSALRLVHHYLMGGWGLEDSERPELAYARG